MVLTRSAGRGLVTGVCSGADGADFGIDNKGLGGIRDPTGNRGIDGFRAQRIWGQRRRTRG